MNILRIEVIGYAAANPCFTVRKTFYVRDTAEFFERVLAWEQEYGICEWSKVTR